MPPLSRRSVAWAAAAVVLAVGAVVAFGLLTRDRFEPPYRLAGASPQRGRTALVDYGCASCHGIPGVRGPARQATVGPPLAGWLRRTYVAGRLANTPPNLVRWIAAPQSLVAGNAMPDLGVPAATARDIASYLYGLH